MNSHQEKEAERIRRWSRFTALETELTIHLNSTTSFRATITDESFGGVGAEADTDGGLTVGELLQVDYAGAPMWAVVRRNAPLPNGRFALGFEWTKAPRKESAAQPTPAGQEVRPDAEFVRLTQTGIHDAWRCFDADQFAPIATTARALQDRARALGSATIAASAEEVQSAILRREAKESLRARIETLFDECLRLCELAE